MSDDVWTTFTIGGKITREQQVELEKLLDGYDECLPDTLDLAMKEKTPFIVSSHRRFGNDYEVETFLKEIGLTYTKSFDGGYEFSAGIDYEAPGVSLTANADSDGNPLISLTELKAKLDEGKTLEQIIADLEIFNQVPALELNDLLAAVELT